MTLLPPHPLRRFIWAILYWWTLLLLILHPYGEGLPLVWLNVQDRLMTARLWPLCGLRKSPLLFVLGEGRLWLVWETNCHYDEMLFILKRLDSTHLSYLPMRM